MLDNLFDILEYTNTFYAIECVFSYFLHPPFGGNFSADFYPRFFLPTGSR